MKETENAKKSLQIVKGQSTSYKMFIPLEVERKIRYLLRKFPSTEWSGVLFTTHTGSFEDNNLEIKCHDIYPMDLGNATFTSFSMSEDVAAYMAEHIELFDCDLQLVHSHHRMEAFFSGTDIDTLKEEGSERNCFVSLIVNNAGTYCAAVTRKVKTTVKYTITSKSSEYEFFGDGKVTDSKETPEEKVMEKEHIEYFMLDITKEEETNDLAYLDERFEEIEKKKKSQPGLPKVIEEPTFWDLPYYCPKKSHFPDKELPEVKKNSPTKFKTTNSSKAEVMQSIAKIVTGSMTVKKDFNIDTWIKNDMEKAFDKMFPSEFAFQNYVDYALDLFLGNYHLDLEIEEAAKIMFDYLIEYYDTNHYITYICNTIDENYIY